MAKKKPELFVEWKFAQKRDEWMRRLSLVPQADIPSGAKLVAFRIALYMHEKKRKAHPSYDALALACGMSSRMVQEHTKCLEQAKWIDVDRKRNRGNGYWLHYPFVDDNGSVVPLITEVEAIINGNEVPLSNSDE